MIHEESSTATNWYTYGLDLSGTLQGAGGIGGLLSIITQDTSNPSDQSEYYYCYDANGNVTDLVDTNGTTVAHYEYDPFGNTTQQSGSAASQNPFRFSTKYLDETGLYYYGYRYYSPQLGRWPSRDPITELGSVLLRRSARHRVTPEGARAYAKFLEILNKLRTKANAYRRASFITHDAELGAHFLKVALGLDSAAEWLQGMLSSDHSIGYIIHRWNSVILTIRRREADVTLEAFGRLYVFCRNSSLHLYDPLGLQVDDGSADDDGIIIDIPDSGDDGFGWGEDGPPWCDPSWHTNYGGDGNMCRGGQEGNHPRDPLPWICDPNFAPPDDAYGGCTQQPNASASRGGDAGMFLAPLLCTLLRLKQRRRRNPEAAGE